ncbi:MAG: RdgB/HAM1 family non-canonical purine NTP pyrophosphatase [Oscillospiraceae bacterium]|nr:RdgB/HAM1 family non-canonical purine NTP pyrophosphatase [Oscillospiraceae bacterium]
MQFILASNNEKKLKELRAILIEMGHEVRSQREAGLEFVAEETGRTFSENARIKARAVVEATGLAAIADDSGIVVEALGGAPGVDSAVYGGDLCETDGDRVRFLLANMEQEDDRRAAFVSVIVCMLPDGTLIEAEGRLEGELLREPRGAGGFGYDPIFFVPEVGFSFAEMDQSVKNRLSHRGRALEKFREMWEKTYADK